MAFFCKFNIQKKKIFPLFLTSCFFEYFCSVNKISIDKTYTTMKKICIILLFFLPMMAMAQAQVVEEQKTETVELGTAYDYYRKQDKKKKGEYYLASRLFMRYVKTGDKLIKTYHFRQARFSYMEAVEFLVRTREKPDLTALNQQIAICDRSIAAGLDADDAK